MTETPTNRTIEQLERDLHAGRQEVLSGPALADIRSRGRGRRRVRLASYVAGAAAAAVVASGVAIGVLGQDPAGEGGPGPATAVDTPKELSPLAARALREIPGAVQVSAWQVLLPAPAAGQQDWAAGETVPADHIAAGPVDIGARAYEGVTSYDEAAFPAWLYEGVGSTDMGIIVDAGPQDLACMRPLPQWTDDNGEARDSQECYPAMLGLHAGERTYAWGMGTDDFLEEGEDLELFHSDVYTSGSPQSVWIGGTDGTDVASVELVAVDGTRVEATVAAGTMVPGETMFWGTVTGDLAVAITYDAAGDVLERHEVEPCSDPVECEVR
jgi:hypothetical protein